MVKCPPVTDMRSLPSHIAVLTHQWEDTPASFLSRKKVQQRMNCTLLTSTHKMTVNHSHCLSFNQSLIQKYLKVNRNTFIYGLTPHTVTEYTLKRTCTISLISCKQACPESVTVWV